MWKNSRPSGVLGVDILCKDLQGDPAFVDIRGCFDDLCERPGQTGEFPDHQRVAITQILQSRLQLGAVPM